MAEASTPAIFTLRGKAIREDAHGRLCLDDIWELAGAKSTRAPSQWRKNSTVKRIADALYKKITNSTLLTKSVAESVFYARQGRGNAGTYAHPVMAAVYAGYLSPELEVEVRETWLRFRAGDATLADEILQRASPEDNRWVAARAQGRAKRIEYTDTLRAHGVRERGYADCTNAVYLEILGATAAQMRVAKGLGGGGNVRDHLTVPQLSYVAAAESLASDRIEELDCRGNLACESASAKSAGFIREAIERDKADRKKTAT